MKTTPTPIRLNDEVRRRIERAANALGIEKQEAIRRAIELGLEVLRQVNYDTESVLVSHLKSRIGIDDPKQKGIKRGHQRIQVIPLSASHSDPSQRTQSAG